jgi:glycyl-tRNA synthetase
MMHRLHRPAQRVHAGEPRIADRDTGGKRRNEGPTMAENGSQLMDKLVALCKRRGFIFQSSEIYGGINGFWDYGPLGVELKRNIKDAWWEDVVRKRDDMVGLDCSIIMNPKVWEASGHLVGFRDPMVSCKAEGCKGIFRADQVFHVLLRRAEGDDPFGYCSVEANSVEQAVELAEPKAAKLSKRHGGGAYVAEATAIAGAGAENFQALKCPRCDSLGTLTEPRAFNLMFKTWIGAMEDSTSLAYLRPETAQGIFANFKNVMDTTRLKLPFGIAQVGKSFRNEINPRNYTFRSREFEQMEIEFFCHPNEADRWYEYWRDARFNWYVGLGLKSSKLRLRNHEKQELAHYARACADIEYEFPFGTSELEGVANRTDFDLTQHQKSSGKDMTYFDDETKEKFIPYVIEPSGGCDRATLAFLCEAYCEDAAPDENGVPQPRTVMKFHPRLAPTKVAVFPLVKKEGMPEVARGIHDACKKAGLVSFYDEKGAVGRRYRRQDEAGTPFCVTVDGQTLQDQTVTIRDRDSLKQERIAAQKVVQYVRERISG